MDRETQPAHETQPDIYLCGRQVCWGQRAGEVEALVEGSLQHAQQLPRPGDFFPGEVVTVWGEIVTVWGEVHPEKSPVSAASMTSWAIQF